MQSREPPIATVMSTTNLDRYIAARLLQADLSAIDLHFSRTGITDMAGITHLKNAFTALANMVDFEKKVRGIYKKHRMISAVFSKNKENYEFAKYLRNKLVGHIHPELIEKTIEWKPVLRHLAIHMNHQRCMFAVNILVLETAINTYVDADGKHRVFPSEIDLLYTPDWMRFIDYLEVSIGSAIHYLGGLCEALSEDIDHPAPGQIDFELYLKAGMTAFAFLRKQP